MTQLEQARAAQHEAALKGNTEESCIQLRRIFMLKGSYQGELDRCGRCGSREPKHPSIYYTRRGKRSTCRRFQVPKE